MKWGGGGVKKRQSDVFSILLCNLEPEFAISKFGSRVYQFQSLGPELSVSKSGSRVYQFQSLDPEFINFKDWIQSLSILTPIRSEINKSQSSLFGGINCWHLGTCSCSEFRRSSSRQPHSLATERELRNSFRSSRSSFVATQ